MHVLSDESLQGRNTLALDSRATAYVAVSSDAELSKALMWARTQQLPVVSLGQGSNVVLAGDVHALVIQQTAQAIARLQESSQSVILKVPAGNDWHEFVTWSLQNGYCGLENLALIPGTVGAAPIQNIGAYGVELASFVRRVHAVRIEDSSAVTLDNSACHFGYRDSVFKHSLKDTVMITAVEFELSKTPNLQLSYPALKESLAQLPTAQLTPKEVFDAVVAVRQTKLPDPKLKPNVGSFFKNPVLSDSEFQQLLTKAIDVPSYVQADGRVKVPAAWLIEKCGWKGRRVGNVGVHPEHALVLVNYGESDGCRLLALARQLSQDVFEQYAVALEIEPRVYGQ